MSDSLKVRQGGRLPLIVEQGDPASVSASLYLSQVGGTRKVVVSSPFVDGLADLTLDENDTSVVGEYEYQINENFASGAPLKYPDPNSCEDEDCSFPVIEVCRALDEED